MAVELAKLSLWLVTLAKGRPFSFLDHALRCGDSLVGVVDVEQVKAFPLDSGARQLSGEVLRALEGTETLLSESAGLRRQIESTAVTDIRVVRDKAELLAQAEALSGKLRLAADAVVGAALAAEGISNEEATDITSPAWRTLAVHGGVRRTRRPRRTRRRRLTGIGWRLLPGWSLPRWGTGTGLRRRGSGSGNRGWVAEGASG